MAEEYNITRGKANSVNIPLDINTILTFGKHTGKKCLNILKTDPSYFIWLKRNTKYTLTSKLNKYVKNKIYAPKR